MSRFLTITSSSSANFGERKKTVNIQTMKVGSITLNFLLAILICMLGVFYIFEVNSIATKGYEIKKMETQIGELKRQNENLKIQAAELKSMYSIEEKTKDLNMVAPKDVSFLSLPGNVAMK
jgi:cell division protein FtsL